MKDILQPLVKEFMPFAQERMGFKKPPRIFLRNDPENAQNPLGKTAYYDPQERSVTLYINGRHPKDIMRSLSHELVHHTQNCNGEFDNMPEMGEGYAQKDPHLREMERKAYEIGNLCLRDWEDTRKGTIYIQNMNVDIQKEGKLNMSTKDWKNRELPTLLTEKWGFSFNLLTESQEEPVEEGMCQQCAPNPCTCGMMQEQEEKPEKEKETDNPDPYGMRAYYDDQDKRELARKRAQKLEEEELEEGGAALRVGNEDRHHQRQAHADRIHEEEEPEEKKSKTKEEHPLDLVPPHTGKPDAKDFAKLRKDKKKDKKKDMNEAQIRHLIRKLVKEAMKRKETK